MSLGRSAYILSLTKEQLRSFLAQCKISCGEDERVEELRLKARTFVNDKCLEYDDMPIVDKAKYESYRPKGAPLLLNLETEGAAATNMSPEDDQKNIIKHLAQLTIQLSKSLQNPPHPNLFSKKQERLSPRV